MSVGPLPPTGPLAGSPLAQGAASESSAAKDGTDAERTARNESRSAEAGGIGRTEEEAESQDRDADGRQLWQRRRADGNAANESAESSQRPSRDPTGDCGRELDLSG